MQDEQTTSPTPNASCVVGEESGTDREHGVLVEVDDVGGFVCSADTCSPQTRRFYEF
jgi:hypothetical protein